MTSRTRLHREQARRTVQGARCSVCHRLVLDVARAYAIQRSRRARYCQECLKRTGGDDSPRPMCP